MKVFFNRIDNVRALQLFQVIRFGSLLFISIAIVKLGLSPTEVGYYETALFLANLLTFFWINGAIQSLLPIFPTLEANTKRSEFLNVALVIAAISMLSGALGFLFEGVLRQTESLADYPHYSVAIVYTMLNAMSMVNEYIYLLLQKPLKMLGYGLASFALQAGCVLIPALFGWGVALMIWGLIAISAIRLLWLVRLLIIFSEFKINLTFIKGWMKKTAPLTLKFLIGGSGNFIDSIIITTFYSSSVFALYRYGAKDFPLILLLANGLSNALLPLFREKKEQAMLELHNRSRGLMHWLFPASIVMMFLAKPMFILVFNAQFETSALIFMTYLLLASSRLLFPQTVAIGLGKNNALLVIAAIELVVNVGLSLLWLRTWGIEGIAMATVVAFLLEKILIAAYLYSAYKIAPGRYTPLKTYLLWMALLLTSYIWARFFV